MANVESATSNRQGRKITRRDFLKTGVADTVAFTALFFSGTGAVAKWSLDKPMDLRPPEQIRTVPQDLQEAEDNFQKELAFIGNSDDLDAVKEVVASDDFQKHKLYEQTVQQIADEKKAAEEQSKNLSSIEKFQRLNTPEKIIFSAFAVILGALAPLPYASYRAFSEAPHLKSEEKKA